LLGAAILDSTFPAFPENRRRERRQDDEVEAMDVSRRALMTTSAALALTPALAQARTSPAARPNIVWIIVHDVHAPLLGCYGNGLARTPAIDSLGRDGIRYTNAFTTTPVCAPSRFALMTGAYPSACAPAHQMRAAAELPEALHPLPLHMRAAGYYCTNNVFTDYNLDGDEGAFWDVCDIKAHWRNRPAGKPFFSVYNYLITHEMHIFGDHPSVTDQAKVEVPPFLPDVREVREVLARNVDIVNRQDLAVAHLLEELEADGLADDTFVFFLADHGGVYPRSKRFCYEDGLRVPLLVRTPANWRHLVHGPVGSPNDELVSHVDLAPATLALAGAPIPKTMDGRAFLGARETPKREYAFSMRDRMDERYDLSHSVRDRRYRYIRNYNPQRIYGEHQAYGWQSIAYQAWERAHLAGELSEAQARFWQAKSVEELYDVDADPHQVRNLADDPAHRAQLERMRQALDAHLVATNDNGFIPEGSPGEGYDQSRIPGVYPLRAVLEVANLALARDPQNLPRFVAGLEDSNTTVRFWNAQGLVLLGPAAKAAGPALAHRVSAEPDANVRCALAEALFAAGDAGAAREALVAVLQGDAPAKAKLRALNVLTVLPPAELRPARDLIASYGDMRDEYFHEAGKYLALRIDGQYRPEARTVGPLNFKVDPNHPMGDPQV
jgi:arylsulfatase A-like enzyme